MNATTVPLNEVPILQLIAWDLFAAAFFAVGIYFLRTPTRKLLQWDSRTRNWVYKIYPKRDGNDDNAVELAGCLHKIFGITCLIISGLHIIAVTGLLIAKLLSH